MKRLLLLFTISISSCSYSQTPEIDWVRVISGLGHEAVHSIQTTSKGYVYCLVNYEIGLGNISNYSYFDSNGGMDLALIKLNRYGHYMWGKKIGGIGNESGNRLHLLSNDNVLLVGGFRDTVDFDPDLNNEVIRISEGSDDCFALVLDENGNYISCKTFGGFGSDVLMGIDENNDQNIWLSGRFQDSINVDPGGTGDIHFAPNGEGSFILKLDQQLNLLESISVHAKDYATVYDLDVSISGDIHFTGYFDDTLTLNYSDSSFQFISNGSVDCFYSIIDTEGKYINHKQIGGSQFETSFGLTECSDGTYIMQIMYEDSLPIEINNSLQLISGSICPSQFACFTKNTALLKWDDMDVLWCTTVNSVNPTSRILPVSDPVVDELDNIYFAAEYKNEVTVNQSGFNNIGQYDSQGGLIAKLSSLGEFTGIYTINGGGSMSPYCIHLDEREFYIAGIASYNTDFDLTESTYSTSFYAGAVVAKYNLEDPYLFANVLSQTKTALYPNPADDKIILMNSNAADFTIIDLSGRKTHVDAKFNGTLHEISTRTLLEGAYILSYELDGQIHSERFIVQR